MEKMWNLVISFIPGNFSLLEGNNCNFEGKYHLDVYFCLFLTKQSEICKIIHIFDAIFDQPCYLTLLLGFLKQPFISRNVLLLTSRALAVADFLWWEPCFFTWTCTGVSWLTWTCNGGEWGSTFPIPIVDIGGVWWLRSLKHYNNPRRTTWDGIGY